MTHNKLKRKHIKHKDMATLILWEVNEPDAYLDNEGMTVQEFVGEHTEYTLYNDPADYCDLELMYDGEPENLPLILVVNGVEVESKIPAGATPIRRPRPTN